MSLLTSPPRLISQTPIAVRLADGAQYQAKLIAKDAMSDLAVLRLIDTNGKEFPCAKLGSSARLCTGEWVHFRFITRTSF